MDFVGVCRENMVILMGCLCFFNVVLWIILFFDVVYVRWFG